MDLDGDGSQPATTTQFVLDGWNPAKSSPVGLENYDVFAEVNADGSSKTRYLRGDVVDELFGRVDYSGGTASGYWYLTDHLGSIRDVVAGSGVVKEYAFGEVRRGTSRVSGDVSAIARGSSDGSIRSSATRKLKRKNLALTGMVSPADTIGRAACFAACRRRVLDSHPSVR